LIHRLSSVRSHLHVRCLSLSLFIQHTPAGQLMTWRIDWIVNEINAVKVMFISNVAATFFIKPACFLPFLTTQMLNESFNQNFVLLSSLENLFSCDIICQCRCHMHEVSDIEWIIWIFLRCHITMQQLLITASLWSAWPFRIVASSHCHQLGIEDNV